MSQVRAGLARILLLAMLTISPAAMAAAKADIFDTLSFSENDLAALGQWQAAIAEMGRAISDLRACEAAGKLCQPLSAMAWLAGIEAQRRADPARKLHEVNAFVNAMARAGSAPLPPPGRPWPSLTEMVTGRGGVLGAALLKYASLKEAGFPARDLRLAMVYDSVRGAEGVVVLVRLDGTDYVLDTGSDAVRETRRIRTLIPHYSFNETTLWIHLPKPEPAR